MNENEFENASPAELKDILIEVLNSENYDRFFSEMERDFLLNCSEHMIIQYFKQSKSSKYDGLKDFVINEYRYDESFTATIKSVEQAIIDCSLLKSYHKSKGEKDPEKREKYENFIEQNKNMREDVINSHVFDISNKVKQAIKLTNIEEDIDHDILHLPYQLTFINTDFTQGDFNLEENIRFKGLLIISDNYELKESIITSIAFKSDDTRVLNIKLDENLEFTKEENEEYEAAKHLRDWIINFLYFLNTQKEVEYRQVKRNKKNQRSYERKREKENRPIIDNKVKLDLSGEMKKYINNLRDMKDSHYSHRFWVRGHWRTLRDKEHYGDNAGTRIWIKPYLKGEGVVVKKDYDVEKNKEKNQKRRC